MDDSESGVTYQIGELAARSGVTPDALRYYERLGLLPPPGRTSGGFRVYAAQTLERLRFIKQAQTLGLSLHEIRELVAYQDHGGRTGCRQVHNLLQSKLADLEAQLVELQDFRNTLSGYLEQCDRSLARDETSRDGGDASCPVLESFKAERP